MRRKKNSKKIIILLFALMFATISFLTIGTVAWFTGSSKNEDSLKFGEIEIDTESEDPSKLVKSITRNIGEISEHIMPGDTVNFNLTIKLTSNSAPAYYLVKVIGSDVLSSLSINGYYFLNTNNELQTVSNEATENNKICGKITAEDTLHLVLPFSVSTDFTEQKATGSITYTVGAIQQENLTIQEAFDLLNNMLN